MEPKKRLEKGLTPAFAGGFMNSIFGGRRVLHGD
jgi:hypothetical protein